MDRVSPPFVVKIHAPAITSGNVESNNELLRRMRKFCENLLDPFSPRHLEIALRELVLDGHVMVSREQGDEMCRERTHLLPGQRWIRIEFEITVLVLGELRRGHRKKR